MKKTNLTSCFILPILELPYEQLVNADFEVYLGNWFVTNDQWGENIYLALKRNSVSEELKQIINSHPQIVSKNEEDGLYIFSISERDKESIIKPFLSGKYSEIDREYVAKNFPQKEYVGKNSHGRPVYKDLVNYKILNKDQGLREWWEEKYGLALPEDAEVWSRPEPKDEIMFYPNDNEIVPESKPAASSPDVFGD